MWLTMLKVRTGRFVVCLAVSLACLNSLRQVGYATPLYDGLVAYWPLDEGTGDVVLDEFGDEMDLGELRFDPEWLGTGGAILGNSALRFDGFEQDVLLAESVDLDIETNAVSVSAWVNFDFLPSELIEPFGGIFDSNQDSYVLYLDRGNRELRFKVTDSDGTAERPGVPESMLTVEKWNHVLGVYDGSEGVAKIYFNGEPIDAHSNSDLTNLVQPGQLASIGANPTADFGNPSVYFLSGAVDDVAVWNRPLGRAEADYLFNSGTGTAVGTANPDLVFVPDQPPVQPVPPSTDPIVHYAFEGNLQNDGSAGSALDGVLLDTPGVNDTLYSPGSVGQGLDLRENPVSQAVDGDGVSVDYELTDSGTILFDYKVDEYFNFQSLWTNSINPDDWEMWIYSDGRLRGRVENDAFVTFDLDTLNGTDETYQIGFTWQRDDENVELKLYVDGELRDQDLVGTWTDPGDTLFIGSGDGANHFGNGIWDEFSIFDVALSEGEILYLFEGASLPGDFNADGVLDTLDIDDLTRQSASGDDNVSYDLNEDNLVNAADIDVWVKDLFGSWIGDANLDSEFNTADLVQVLASGAYEVDVDSVWSSGDFNGNGRTDTADLVAALADGGYEKGLRPALAAVPEPSGGILLAIALPFLVRRRRKRVG